MERKTSLSMPGRILLLQFSRASSLERMILYSIGLLYSIGESFKNDLLHFIDGLYFLEQF